MIEEANPPGARKRSEIRILLLQTRRAETVRVEERGSFAEHAGLDVSQIDVLDAFETPDFDATVVDGYDALFVGGASEASVLEPETYRFVRAGEVLMQECINRDFPVLASCFGFQMAVIALGGEITRDEDEYEFGTLPISLTPAATDDSLFHDMPDGFLAVSGHKEKATDLPDGCELLGYTEICAHAFRYPGRRFWATQFHPELDRTRLVQRLEVYKDQYMKDENHYREMIASLQETPDSNQLLRKFVDRVILDS